MREKRLAANTLSSLTFQVMSIICGFILPRLILQSFGSEVNGLVNSITQFLTIISFLELGVGAVVQSALYKPLAEKDNATISRVIASAGKFFRRLAQILLAYIVVLMFVYPHIVAQDFGWVYTACLIAAMSISSFAQYYFGVVDRLLLSADQHGYVQYNAQTITLILNTIACVVLIELGQSIHVVKLTTSLIYLARPLFLRWYVNRHYQIDRKIKYTGEPIAQKWNGVAQHVSAVVLDSTASIILSVFSTLSNASIYSVYNLVVYGVKQLFMSMTNGVHALIGELWARQETDSLRRVFSMTEWLIHTGATLIFGCVGVLVVPFVQVYTLGITDANYSQPLFAVIFTLAHGLHCLRLPYSIMILSAGHYKQTQHSYIVAVCMNLTIAVVAVNLFGLIGVALGTFAAMAYQTVWMARYVSRNLIRWPFKFFLKQVGVDALTVLLAAALTAGMVMQGVSYLSWILLAIPVFLVWLCTVAAVNFIFYRNNVMAVVKKFIKK